jgi:hypothetical protein
VTRARVFRFVGPYGERLDVTVREGDPLDFVLAIDRVLTERGWLDRGHVDVVA